MKKIGIISMICAAVFATLFFIESRPLVPAAGDLRKIAIIRGEGIREIAIQLYEKKVVRSPYFFMLRALLSREAGKLKPGSYFFPKQVTTEEILKKLSEGPRDITVMVPEGESVYEIDELLSHDGIIEKGELVSYAEPRGMEGMLFPDTYRFFEGSSGADVAEKMRANFASRAEPLFGGNTGAMENDLILASMVQNEIPEYEDERIVAGILKKRMKAGMPLQVDASLCYYEKKNNWEQGKPPQCNPDRFDFQVDSPYNTYRNSGFPPTPIGNPGIQAIKAVLNAKSSPYWYYVSDPKTKKTVFAVTLAEHNRNVSRYLVE